MFQRIRKTPDKSVGSSAEQKDIQAVPNVEDDQPLNPFTEIQILAEHTDILKFLVQIDEQRCCTGGDDHLIFIWDVHFGKRLHALDGHFRPLTCLSVCYPPVNNGSSPILLSAASDKLICMWHVDTGNLLRSVNEHGCTARAFAVFSSQVNYFCSGGENLSLWQLSGDVIQKLSRSEEEDIQHILVLDDSKIVAASDKLLTVYSIHSEENTDCQPNLQQHRQMTSHSDTITAITRINETSFASGSLDGTIILWSSQDFSNLKFLSLKRRDYQGSDKLYPYSIQHLLCIDDRFMVCAMGSGFHIQDTVTDKHLAEVWNAHFSKILHLTFVFGGLMLATCSEDGSVRLWGNSASFKHASSNTRPEPGSSNISDDKELVTHIDKFLGLRVGEATDLEKLCKLELLGECLGHTGAVQKCIKLGTEGFVSCGKDGMVIVWKDGLRQEMRRNEIIRDLLYGASADFN